MQKNFSNCQFSATVTGIQPLNHDIVELAMTHKGGIAYQAGQFITITSPDGLASRYSIANSHAEDKTIRIHITRSKKNPFSLWVHDQLTTGETLAIDKPKGQCFYQPGNPDQALVLIGTDCGLAPVSGILQDALKHKHTGPIYLFHGASDVGGLYWVSRMAELMQLHPNFRYFPCTTSGHRPPGYTAGQACDVAVRTLSKSGLHGWRVFLYGTSSKVGQAIDSVSKAGTVQNDIKTQRFSSRYQANPSVDWTNHPPVPCTG